MNNSKKELLIYRKKENKLLYSTHYKSYYRKFEKTIKNTTDFYKIKTSNFNKFNCPIKIKDFKLYDWVLIVILTFICGIITFDFTQLSLDVQRVKSHIYNESEEETKLVLFTSISALLGLWASIVSIKDTKSSAKENNIGDFYKRLSLHIFDYIKEFHHELTDDILNKYNPAIAEIITELLITNMDSKDVKELRSIAIDLAYKIDNNIIGIKEYKLIFNKASEIIKNSFKQKPNLYYAVSEVFKGYIPITFDLNNNKTMFNIINLCKTKEM